MKYFIITLIYLLIGFGTIAQTIDPKAEAILNKLSEKAKNYKTVEASFTFTQRDKKADETSTQKGEVKVEGEKYMLILGDYQIFNDGTLTWTYDSDLNEATKDYTEDVKDPDSPSFSEMLTMWENGFSYAFEEEKTVGGVTYQIVNLYPTKDNDKPFHTAKLTIDKKKSEIVKIILLGKDGIDYIYEITSFKVNTSLSASTFTIDLKALNIDDADVIDNTL
jgi:outer membrane lipoprotein-sorting protein